MSVIVKNMEMPKNCKECMFADFDDVDFDYELYCTANEKYADLDMCDHPMGWNCPLIDIPTPHGRLGDLDELYKAANMADDFGADTLDMLKLIADTPTVIEAEGETDGR